MSQGLLFEPTTLGDYRLKNRLVMAPMTRGRAGSERVPNDIMAEHYFQRASAGLLITEATVVSAQGIGWIGSPGIYTDEMVEGWRKVTDRLKPTGTPIFLQLWHCGRASHSDFHNGALPVSASAVRLNGDTIRTPLGKKPYETPRPLTVDEIKAVVDDYRKAAANAKAAGFSGIEVHGANGYLINQFLDSTSNRRQDQYGGSLENRFRFFREVLEAVLDVWPAKHVGARISPNGVHNDMGCDDYRDLFPYVAAEIDKLHLGYLHIMDGLAFGFHGKGEPMTLAEFRPLFKGLIIGNCGYTEEAAEARIAAGDADLIAFGRPYITNPDLPERFRNGWPLNPAEDMSLWYTPGPEGYTDYAPFRP
ncbi:MAG: alkene reductase [Desulfoprunum sp.]|jgi:N-ethylmaleimide reductase|uniref:alkene reductase n=1 Tax=Desulfoprunum sp. TaxID=2020866 RepID=UPI003C721A32